MKIKLFLFFILIFMNVLTAEYKHNYELNLTEIDEKEGWKEYFNEFFMIKFPSKPVKTESEDFIHYAAVDNSTFPLSIYHLVCFTPEEPIDIEKFVGEIFQDSSQNKRMVLWNEIKETENGMIVDLLSHEKNTYMMRKEHVIISPTEAYILSTSFFTISIDNHDYFIDSFISF